MRLGLKLVLGFFLIVGIAAFFVMRVFVNEVKPGVRQAMESTLVDAANMLAEMAADDLKAGHIADGAFAVTWYNDNYDSSGTGSVSSACLRRCGR